MKNKFYLYCILCFLFNVAGYSQSTVFESLSFESNMVRNAVYGNLKLMKKTLTDAQYTKYTTILNMTLKNKGIEVK